MSLATWTSGLFAITPRVTLRRGRLVARTNLLLQFLSLFSYCKTVEASRAMRRVVVSRRVLWVLAWRRSYAFSRIRGIRYEFGSLPTAWSMFVGTTDEWEWFSVWLTLDKPHERVALFSFAGDGAVQTGWQGTLLGGDDFIDTRGDQELQARGFVDALIALTGATLV